MRRILGVVLIFHGLAHAGAAGMWSLGASPIEAHTVWWMAATGGFILAGCALLGVRVARARWQAALLIALAGSFALLVQRTHPVAVVGLARAGPCSSRTYFSFGAVAPANEPGPVVSSCPPLQTRRPMSTPTTSIAASAVAAVAVLGRVRHRGAFGPPPAS